ncbi:TetR/AcrR family transcriptional regulator [Castellaniella sp.]|uniref:TetR/AcrR family transcriptional regulator n=1 Tax=Castellaniella sp. TaxID=1955812 RepID=UPI002AFF4E26|nr:TetR/AcrR family transcriptional regulator [Castellaniella sp.]
MNPKIRLTRQQSQAQTRQRLLAAAHALFAAHGFNATSVEQIALEAGYSRGAFYSNFQTKAEVFLVLLQQEHEAIMAELHTLLETPAADDPDGTPPRHLLEARLLDFYARLHRNTTLQVLLLEARLLALRDPDFAMHFQRFQQHLLDAVGHYALIFTQRAGLAPSMAPQDMALGFVALCDGMALYRMENGPADDNERAEHILRAFMKKMAFEP